MIGSLLVSSFFVFFVLRKEDDRLWECGNLAFWARFPSPCGNRFLVSIGTPFPQPLLRRTT